MESFQTFNDETTNRSKSNDSDRLASQFCQYLSCLLYTSRCVYETDVYVVPEQELTDGDFPTVSYPNPEAKEAFALGLALAKEKDADLVLATDPDADRLGVYVKDAKSGEYIPLTGNMSGSLLCEYVLSQKKEKAGSLPAEGAVVKSIVTTNLVDEIAKAYNVKLIEVLTGFKWIGKEILGFEPVSYTHLDVYKRQHLFLSYTE